MKRYEVTGMMPGYNGQGSAMAVIAKDIDTRDLAQEVLLEAVSNSWYSVSIKEYEAGDYYVDPLLIQAVASVMHGSWKGWMAWVLHCLDSSDREAHLKRWKSQVERNYADLSQAERKSDVEEARKYLETVYNRGIAPGSLSLLSYAKLFDEAIQQCAIPAEFIHRPNSFDGVNHVVRG